MMPNRPDFSAGAGMGGGMGQPSPAPQPMPQGGPQGQVDPAEVIGNLYQAIGTVSEQVGIPSEAIIMGLAKMSQSNMARMEQGPPMPAPERVPALFANGGPRSPYAR